MSRDRRSAELRVRRLLRCYPRSWRAAHGDEVVEIVVDEGLGWRGAVDLLGHGLEARLDGLVSVLPERLRRQVATAALVAGAGVALLLLVGEVIGARFREPGTWASGPGGYFMTGPFLSIGVGLYLALMSATLLVVLRRPGLARLLLVLGVAYAAWMALTQGNGYPVPRLPLLVLTGGLASLATLTTVELDRRGRRDLGLAGAGFVVVSALAVLATKPMAVLGWSVGTMTTSGYVAIAALAVALPVVCAAAVLVTVLRTRGRAPGRRTGWPAALAIAALPVVAFCTMTSIRVNPPAAASRAWIPVAYVAVLVLVAVLVRRRGGPGAKESAG